MTPQHPKIRGLVALRGSVFRVGAVLVPAQHGHDQGRVHPPGHIDLQGLPAVLCLHPRDGPTVVDVGMPRGLPHPEGGLSIVPVDFQGQVGFLPSPVLEALRHGPVAEAVEDLKQLRRRVLRTEDLGLPVGHRVTLAHDEHRLLVGATADVLTFRAEFVVLQDTSELLGHGFGVADAEIGPPRPPTLRDLHTGRSTLWNLKLGIKDAKASRD
mmetsp:Transcript_110627/g.191769  ORF Transcript_110627/g.191769 Transcript_110627/m.191769 type:complete len:212 (-) Transcript_110627:113-748(-)